MSSNFCFAFQHDVALKANIVSQTAFLLFEVNEADKNFEDGLLKSDSYYVVFSVDSCFFNYYSFFLSFN